MLSNLRDIWDSWGPYKVQVFSWQLPRDRFPFIENVFKRNVITILDETLFTFCGDHIELASNLFDTCSLFVGVWCRIFVWLWVHMALPKDFCLVFLVFFSLYILELR